MRLIDADALEEGKFHGIEDWTPIESASWQRGWNDALKSVMQFAPTVEVVAKNETTTEVVRCKDCKHKPTGSGVNHDITFPEQDYRCPCRCEDYWYSWMPDDDWFCANGERREDANS